MSEHTQEAWEWEGNYDQSCGLPCTVNGCHDSHFSGTYSLIGPDVSEGGDETRFTDKGQVMILAAAPDLLVAAEAVAYAMGLDETFFLPGSPGGRLLTAIVLARKGK